ncbi:MAG: zf-HC2 domain-containing protein, partial [Candidatus Aminicenantes bacterium]|nr:zf-HC2 domain-containing protein [Candidatus Aminicenantes bacterium]
MNHDKALPLLGAYHDGELQDREKKQIEEHLKDCPACREELKSLARIDALSKGQSVAVDEATYWDSFAARVASGIRSRSTGAAPKEAAMFQDSFIRTQKNLAVKAWVFPLSFATHAILAAVLIVIPLLN